MSLQGHTARREREVSVGSMVQWFRRGLDDQVETEDERDSKEFSGADELSDKDKDKAKV